MSDPLSPWDDCKVAFGYNPATYEGTDLVWSPDIMWPAGWSVCEIDESGARVVVIFRVEGPLLLADGQRVREYLDELSRSS